MPVLSEYFQMFWICMSSICAEYIFCKEILGVRHQKKSFFALVVYGFSRFIFFQVYYTFYLGSMYADRDWYVAGSIFLQAVQYVIYALVMNYSFRGDLVKILLYSFAVETITSVVIMQSQILVVGEVQSRIACLSFELAAKILAGILLAFLIFALTRKVLHRYLIRLQDYEIKHKRFFGVVILLFFLYVLYANSNQQALSGQSFIQLIGLSMLAMGVFLISTVVYSLWIYWNRKKQNHLFSEQLSGLENVIKEEGDYTDNLSVQNQVIEELLKNLTHFNQKEVVAKYIKALKEQYERLQMGVYCNNRRIDAFLSIFVDECRKNDIEAIVHFQGFEGGHVKEEDMEMILWILLQTVLRLAKETELYTMTLRVTEPGQYILLWLETGKIDIDQLQGDRILKECQREMKSYLKSCHDIMNGSLEEDKFTIKMMLG